MAKDTFYFTHDYNARTDLKIKNLLRKHGMRGYGVYWSIIEDLYNNENSLNVDYEGIAYDMHEDVSVIKSIINDFELFVIDNNFFGSESVERRLNERNAKSKKAQESAQSRWSKVRERKANAPKTDANALRTESDGNAINKGKEIKEIKEKNYKKILLSEITISDFPELNEKHIEIAKAFNSLFRNNLTEAGASTKIVDNAKGTNVDDIRLLLEADHYTVENLQEVYRFLQTNSFWKKNILSTSKLREKMDKLKLELKNGTNKSVSKEGTSWGELASIVAGAYAEAGQ